MSTILVPASNFTVLTSTLGNSVSFSKQSSDEGTIWEGFEINDSGVEILRFLQKNNVLGPLQRILEPNMG